MNLPHYKPDLDHTTSRPRGGYSAIHSIIANIDMCVHVVVCSDNGIVGVMVACKFFLSHPVLSGC